MYILWISYTRIQPIHPSIHRFMSVAVGTAASVDHPQELLDMLCWLALLVGWLVGWLVRERLEAAIVAVPTRPCHGS